MNDHDLATLRRDRGKLEDALREAGVERFTGTVCRCPFHEDTHASAGMYEDAGVWRFKCHGCGAGGDVVDVLAKVRGKTPADVLREMSDDHRSAESAGRSGTRGQHPENFSGSGATNTSEHPGNLPECPVGEGPENFPYPSTTKAPKVHPDLDALRRAALWATRERGTTTVEAVYTYTNPTTRTPDLLVLRLPTSDGGKTFLQARPEAGGYVLKAPAGLLPIYNRGRVAAAAEVIVVEGERCVHALAEIGIVATTSPGGAGKAARADWSPLAGKTCYLWPDHDPKRDGRRKGHDHMREVAEILLKLGCVVIWIDPEFLALDDDGSDVVDYLAEYGGDTRQSKADAVRAALTTAQPLAMPGVSELRELLEQTIAGKRRTIPFPWPQLTKATRALMPGTVTCLCADPGAGKTFLLLDALAFWVGNGVKTGVFMLEEDRNYHLNRILAQLDQRQELTDTEWIAANPTEVREALARHEAALAKLAPCIDAAPDAAVTHKQLLAWIETKAKAGCRIIAIDPITAAAVSDKPWADDLAFLMAAKTLARRHAFSLLLSTHPRKGKRVTAGLDDLAGGAAYPRFAQTVLWLLKPETPKRVQCAGTFGTFTTTVNRMLRLGKTRNGPGGGWEIGMDFSAASLRFAEQGIIVDDDGGEPAETHDPFSDAPTPTTTTVPAAPAATTMAATGAGTCAADLDLEGL